MKTIDEKPVSDLLAEPDDERARQAQRAKLTALGQMAGSVAHEINNPLSVIRMNAELLVEYCNTFPNSEKIVDKCQKIIATSDRISGIIRALKSISSNSTAPNFKWTKLSRVIDDVVELCSPKLKMNSTELRMDISAIQDMEFLIDSAQVSQSVINLLSNAVDAIHALPEKWVKISGTVKDGFLTLTVTDSGHGIPDTILAKILTPFFSTKEKHDGLGIGLNLVQSYAAFHEGSLQYALTEGQTSFTLSFPLSKVQPSAAS